MKTLHFLMLLISSLSLARCAKAPTWEDDSNDNVPPGTILNPIVRNFSGGATIKYTLPADEDLLGVKALYTYTDGGKIQETYSSAYTDSITINGFPDTQERSVQLIVCDNNNNESPAVVVNIKPLIPPVEYVRNSLTISETFGGVLVKWENPSKANIGVSLYAEDELGLMNLDYTYFTKESGFYAFRGYQNKEKKFQVAIRDQWNNMAMSRDTLLTPLFEEDIVARNPVNNVCIWSRYGYSNPQTTTWRGDYIAALDGQTGFPKMFDGSIGNGQSGYFNPGVATTTTLDKFTGDITHKGINPKPLYLTVDMTRKAKISRFKLYFRGGAMNQNDPYHIVLWGLDSEPKGPEYFENDKLKSLTYWTSWPEINGQDTWKNDWKKLADVYIIPPSGATESYQWTDEDLKWAQAGIDFECDAQYSDTPFRYLRFECIDNIKKTSTIHFAEWEFYGNIVK